MKSTDRSLFSCERERERLAALASEAVSDCSQEESDKEADDKAFWKVVYVLTHIVGLLAVLIMIYEFWGQ